MQAVLDGSPPSENSELDRRTAPAGAEGTADAHETALIRSARAGDHLAYAELVRAHERLAFRTAYVIAGPDDAEEAAQNAFIKAHGALNRFTPGRPFRPWLLKIVVNEARTVRRAAYRHRAVGGRVADAFDANAATASAAAEAAQTETDKTLREAIARLPARHRDVVICRYLLELSELETAQTLDLRPGTVK